MRLYYLPKGGEAEYDITDEALVEEAWVSDECGGRRDGLEIWVSGAGLWKKWDPKADDQIRATLDGYDTGRMYIACVFPEGDMYRIYASGCPRAARVPRMKSWRNGTLSKILMETGAYCGMGYALHGVDGGIAYPYMAQREGAEAFFRRLAGLEGACVKTYDGRFMAIGTQWAMDREAATTITLDGETPGAEYTRRDDLALSALTVRTPWGEGAAWDGAQSGAGEVILNLPARSAAEARRWARAKLLERNMRTESLEFETDFRKEFTAMGRVDIEGDRYAAGRWLITRAAHDLTRKKSRIQMARCIETIR